MGSGGSPESVIRAARYGLPLMLAVIGGRPERFRPLVDLYRRALAKYEHPTDLPTGLHTLSFVAPTDEGAMHGRADVLAAVGLGEQDVARRITEWAAALLPERTPRDLSEEPR